MREKSITGRAFRQYYGYYKRYFPLRFLRIFFEAVSPYFQLWISAQIVTALYAGEHRMNVRMLVFAALFGNLALHLLGAFLERETEDAGKALNAGEAAAFNKKTLSLDYDKLEDVAIKRLRRKIVQNSWINNYGTGLMRQEAEKLLSSAIHIVLCVILFADMLAHMAQAETALLPVALLLLLLVFLAAAVKYHQYVQKKLAINGAECADQMMKENRFADGFDIDGKDSRIYRQQEIVSRIDREDNERHLRLFARMDKKDRCLTAPAEVIGLLPEFMAYLIVCYYCTAGIFPVGSVILYVGYLNLLIREMIHIFRSAAMMKENTAFLKTYLEYFDLPNDMYQGSLAVEKRSDKKFEIEFRNVSFRYAGAKEDAVKDVSLKLRVGERLAVVGVNGSGKTTFIKLLCRLYDPTAGEIIMNDFNIRKYDYREYLKLFSVVFQDYRLPSLPLGNNVAASETYDAERAEHVLRETGFGERFGKMPKGLETPLYRQFDSDGVNISGGEAQKIALARALYRDAPFIVLDEPTAALDPVAEAEIYANFDRIVQDKTVVYISHRLSSCRFCDRILVFDGGRIVQTGTHEELLKDAQGKYYELWNAQAQYYHASCAGD